MPTGAPAALFVNDIINKHINAGHFQAGCMFNFIFNAVGNALRDGSDVQAIPHFDVQGDDQPPFLLAYGNAFFGQGAVAQRFAHCAGGRALAHGGNAVTVFGSFGHKAGEVIIRKRNMSQRIHSCDHLRSSLWNTDEFPASGLTLLPGSMCVSYS